MRKIEKHRRLINASYWQYKSAVCALDALLKANQNRNDCVLAKPIDEAIESLIDATQRIKSTRQSVYNLPNRAIYKGQEYGKRNNHL